MTDTPTPQYTAASDKPAKHPLQWLIMPILILQLAMAGWYVYRHEYPAFMDKAQSTDEQQNKELLGALEEWSAQIETKLEELEQQQADADAALEDMAEIRDEMQHYQSEADDWADEIESRIEALEDSTLSDERIGEAVELIAALETVQNQLETQGSSRWQAIQLLSSYDPLKRAILAGEPYGESLYAFRLASEKLDGSTQWISQLVARQASGIPTAQELYQTFSATRNVMAHSDQQNDGLLAELQSNLSQLVTVRKVGNQHTGSGIDDILARAEHALKHGDIEAAITELQSLPDPQRASFATLLSDAKEHLGVRSLLKQIHSAILTTVEAAR